jgi:hypothetical protein
MSEQNDIDQVLGKNFQGTVLGKIVSLTQASNEVNKRIQILMFNSSLKKMN